MAYNGPGDAESIGYTGGSAGALGAIIGAGAQLYDSYQNRKTAERNTDKTIAAQKAEAELAWQRSIEQMNYMNLYNSPAAQMARFKAGGLNPNLIYGQGNPGNQSGTPQYHPADIQYKYAAAQVAPGLTSILPMLMEVGTWMQSMRASEVQIDKAQTDTARVRQLIEYLTRRNPQLLEEGGNRLSLFPYQSQLAASNAERARSALWEIGQEFRYKYGEDLWRDSGMVGSATPQGGVKRLQFLQEASKTKLLDAKSSWSEFDITDPQHLMEMVLGGVFSLAGQQLRLSGRPASTGQINPKRRERPRGLNYRRMESQHPDRR